MAYATSISRSSAVAPKNKWSFVDTLIRLEELSRQRTQLRKLDAERLKDLGLSKAEVEAELSAPIWTRL